MKKYTLIANDHELTHLNKVYSDHLKPNNNKSVLFHANYNDVDIIGYKDGKVLIKGDDIMSELLGIKQMLNREKFKAIGSSEVGTKDVFGPVVVCAAYASVEDVEFLESLNLTNVNTLSDKFIVSVAPKIAKRLTHSIIILDPDKYNKLVDEGYNLNRIKAHLHNQAIISLTAKLKNKQVPVILEQFCAPHLYFNYLKDETLVFRDLEFAKDAEDIHIVLTAAGIIARYGFLYSLGKCSQIAGQQLLKGASKKVDKQLAGLVEEHGVSILDKVAKTNFRNVTKQDF